MKSISSYQIARATLRAEVQEKLIVEQYKQLHSDSLESSRVRWKIIGLGGTLMVALLTAAHNSTELASASILSGIAIPISLLLFVAYRKAAYFENIYNETAEQIECKFGVFHVQRDTLPQKAAEQHYLVRLPRKGSIESLSSFTIQLNMLLMFHAMAVVTFMHYFNQMGSIWFGLFLALGVDFTLLALSTAVNRNYRNTWWKNGEE